MNTAVSDRAALLERIRQKKDSSRNDRDPETPVADRTSGLPLSDTQRRLWFVERLDPAAGQAYRVMLGLRLVGELDRRALERTLHALVERHESLRTVFRQVDGRPVQVIRPSERKTIIRDRDLSDEAVEDQEARLEQIYKEEEGAELSLENGPLFCCLLVRLEEARHVLVITIHHIVTDGWSSAILIKEFRSLYAAHAEGREPRLPALTRQYVDYDLWRRERFDKREHERQIAFWRARLEGAPEVLDLPVDRPRPQQRSHRSGQVKVGLAAADAARLRAFGIEQRMTPFTVLAAAWAVVLGSVSNTTDVVLGTPVANRANREFENIVGFFANTLAVRFKLDGNPVVSDILKTVRDTLLEAYDHQDAAFDDVVSAVGVARDVSHTPLFQAVIALNNASRVPLEDVGGLAVHPFAVPRSTTPFDLALSLTDDGLEFTGTLDFAIDIFERDSAERLARYFSNVLRQMVLNPSARLGDIKLMDADEEARWVRHLNPTLTVLQTPTTLHQMFEAQCARDPSAIALTLDGEHLSYGELNRRADLIARQLVQRGVGPNDRVAVCMERSFGLIAGLIGILKAGGAYVPLDPASPLDRLTFLLADSEPKAILVQSDLDISLRSEADKLLVTRAGELEEPLPGARRVRPVSDAERQAGPEDLAYIIYTSGSTGRPKGVLIEHRQATRLFTSTEHWFRFGSRDVWTFFHSVAFDFSVWEIWGALLFGGRLVIVPQLCARSPKDFHALVCRERVSVLNQTPTAFRQFMAASGDSATRHDLRLVIFGGEALDLDMLKPWAERNDPERTQLVNMYGITETTVHVTYRRLSAADIRSSPGRVIGCPIPDLRFYILDRFGNVAPPLVKGEIYVGGQGVARGYHNREDLTQARFSVHSIGPEPERLYRSGDLARFRVDGEVEYLGRNDLQVKIRGFRIELGEIEAALREVENVRDAIVIAREYGANDIRLVAYYVPLFGAEIDAATVRGSISGNLPPYMVPSAFIPLEKLPLTTNGKLDTKSLPAPDDHSVASNAFEAPVGPLEIRVAGAFAQAIGIARVGRDDDFFSLGGNSMLAVQVVAGLSGELNRDVPLRALFQAPTPSGLAGRLQEEEVLTSCLNIGYLRRCEGGRTVFFVHPVEGEIGYVHRLEPHLPVDLGLVGLVANGLREGEVPHGNLDLMVRDYLAAIRSVQPEGPYRLVGWSAGGSIAHAMAAELKRQGHRIEHLVLIDTIADYVGIDESPGRAVEHQFRELGIDQAISDRYSAVRRSIYRCAANYRPAPLGVPVTLIAAKDELRSNPSLGWACLEPEELHVVEVPGTHYTMVDEPHVRNVARVLSQVFGEPEAGNLRQA